MANRIQYRRDTAANWTAANPVLALGEPAWETDTKKRKIGDGVTAWNSLGYQAPDQATLDATYAGMGTDKGREYLGTKRRLALREWYRALARRTTAPAVLYHIGDSISECSHATSILNRWPVQLQSTLRTSYPVTGAPGHSTGYLTACPTFNATQWTDWPITLSGNWSRDTSHGLGLHGVYLADTTGKIVLSFSGCTFIDVFYVQQTTTSAFSWQIDAGATTTVTAGGAGSNADFRSTRVTVPDTGSHTLTIQCTNTGANINGFYLGNGDETKGFRIAADGRSSAQSSYFTGFSDRIGQQVSQLQPSLVSMEFGANDYAQNTTSAAFKTNVQSLISTVRANCTRPPSIVLHAVWAIPVSPGPTAEPWANYVKALYDIAANDPAICVFDLQQRFTTYAGGTTGDSAGNLLDTDNTHPNNDGNWLYANSYARFIAAD